MIGRTDPRFLRFAADRLVAAKPNTDEQRFLCVSMGLAMLWLADGCLPDNATGTQQSLDDLYYEWRDEIDDIESCQ